MNDQIPSIPVRGTIRLGQLLKLANLVEHGGEARSAIQNGFVCVDGEVETRRGKQLHDGQVVTVDYGDEVAAVRIEVVDQ